MYPVVIEYHVPKEMEIDAPYAFKVAQAYISKQTYTQNYQRQIRDLLSSITNYRFYYPAVDLQWFFEFPDGELNEDVNKMSSKAALNFFSYPEMNEENQINGFTETGLPKIEFIKHPDCFMHLDIDGLTEVKLPEHTDAVIRNFFALSQDIRDVVNSATSLICNGIDLQTKMKSLSFVSFVSSIETMVNHEFMNEKVKKCATCETEQYRVMGKFRDYLLKYASDNEKTKKEVNDIYKIRSEIAHKGLLLLGDNKIDWSNDTKQNEQWQTHIQVMQISKVSLTNWLLMCKL